MIERYRVIATSRRQALQSNDDHTETRLIHHTGCKLDDPESIHQLFVKNRENSEAIVHLAAVMDFHPGNNAMDRGESVVERMRQANVDATRKIFEEFLNAREKKVFIYSSTQAAMGPSQQETGLMDENSPCNPTFEYGRSKLDTENILREMMENYMQSNNSDVKHLYILRLTGVTGKGDRYAAFEMIQASAYG